MHRGGSVVTQLQAALAIAVMLGKMNKELVDSIRPEIREHLEPLIAQHARGQAG